MHQARALLAAGAVFAAHFARAAADLGCAETNVADALTRSAARQAIGAPHASYAGAAADVGFAAVVDALDWPFCGAGDLGRAVFETALARAVCATHATTGQRLTALGHGLDAVVVRALLRACRCVGLSVGACVVSV